jgi:hypothetical protein
MLESSIQTMAEIHNYSTDKVAIPSSQASAGLSHQKTHNPILFHNKTVYYTRHFFFFFFSFFLNANERGFIARRGTLYSPLRGQQLIVDLSTSPPLLLG